jgi:hypothetical protein
MRVETENNEAVVTSAAFHKFVGGENGHHSGEVTWFSAAKDPVAITSELVKRGTRLLRLDRIVNQPPLSGW